MLMFIFLADKHIVWRVGGGKGVVGWGGVWWGGEGWGGGDSLIAA